MTITEKGPGAGMQVLTDSPNTARGHDAGHRAGPAPTRAVVASSAADAVAVEAVKAHHAELAGQLGLLTELLLTAATPGGGSFEDARRRAVAFCADELVPHARAEETSLYPAAAASGSARLLVESMIAEHHVIIGLVDEMARATQPLRAAAAGYALKLLFDTHLAKENDLVLPVVAADPSVSLASILEGMHELLGAADSPDGCGCGGGCGCGHGGEHSKHSHAAQHAHAAEPAAAAAPSAGCGCGSAYGAADQAAQPTAVPSGGCGCGGHDEDAVPELDVREVPHAIRHATVFGAFDAVPEGGSLVLVAPHDPVPLLKQLAQRSGGHLTVSYLERGPEAWRLMISRG